MLHTARKVIKDIMTGKDNRSFAYARIWGTFILATWFIVSFIAVMFLHIRFDLNGWGGVTTAIYTAVNAAIRMTHAAEPEPYQPTPDLPQDQ